MKDELVDGGAGLEEATPLAAVGSSRVEVIGGVRVSLVDCLRKLVYREIHLMGGLLFFADLCSPAAALHVKNEFFDLVFNAKSFFPSSLLML